MKRLLYTLLASLVLLSACSIAPVAQEATVPAQARTSTPSVVVTRPVVIIVDALGRKVTFSKPPTRIVITGKGLILTLDAAYMFPDAPSRIVALGNADQGSGNFVSLIDPNFDQKVILQTDAGAEQIAAVKPDLDS